MAKKDLMEIIKAYSKNHNFYSELISSKSKDNIIKILTDLITLSINDKNSSKIREMVTVLMANYIPTEEKIGYDGYKISQGTKFDFIEVKPKNIYTKSDGKLNSKLDGSGNFTDFRWSKFQRIKNDNISMIISGFSHGKIIYIIKFKFNSHSFLKNLERQLIKRFPNKKDIEGQWLRSARFGFNHYKDSKSLELIYKCENLNAHKNELTRDLYNYLNEN